MNNCCSKCYFAQVNQGIVGCLDPKCPCHTDTRSGPKPKIYESLAGYELVTTKNGWEAGIKDEIRTIVRLVSVMEPKSEAELMGVAVPNLSLFVHKVAEEARAEMLAEAKASLDADRRIRTVDRLLFEDILARLKGTN